MDHSILKRHPRVVQYRLTGGEALLLHLDSGAYHELNPIGATIWELVDGQRTCSEITQELSEKIEDPPDDLDTVVTTFLEELDDRDLLG